MRLLVVDDNAEWRHAIADATEAEHKIVGFVDRGDQIMEAAEKLRPEVVTLDVSMPGKSGLNVLPGLRKLLPKAIIVVVSARMTPLYTQEARARGADGYVEKRRVFSDLASVIASVRSKHLAAN